MIHHQTRASPPKDMPPLRPAPLNISAGIHGACASSGDVGRAVALLFADNEIRPHRRLRPR